jgi:peptidoglycan/LPS O-acetylase OafA/YrhL
MKRNSNLDVLRGVAVLMVLGRHFPILWIWDRIGWAGVDLFFVLSGFLISGLLFREWQTTGDIDIRRFYIRRGLKIYPPLYLFLIVATLIQWRHSPGEDALRVALFIQNYGAAVHGLTIHTWSLAVEEHFYLMLPLALWFAGSRRRPFEMFAPATGIVCLCVLGLRLAFDWHTPTDPYAWMRATHLRIDSLLFGVLLGWMRHFRPALFARIASSRLAFLPLVTAVAGLILFPVESPFMRTIGFSINYLGFGALLMIVLDRKPRAFLRPVSVVGENSYSIYLWHMLFAMLLPQTGMWWIAYLAMSVGAGIALSGLVEIPVLRLRDRLFPAVAKAPMALCAA